MPTAGAAKAKEKRANWRRMESMVWVNMSAVLNVEVFELLVILRGVVVGKGRREVGSTGI